MGAMIEVTHFVIEGPTRGFRVELMMTAILIALAAIFGSWPTREDSRGWFSIWDGVASSELAIRICDKMFREGYMEGKFVSREA